MSTSSFKNRKCGLPTCSKPSIKCCSGCQAAYYCSRECQRAHWKAGHRKKCEKMQARKVDEKLKKARYKRDDATARTTGDAIDQAVAMEAETWFQNTFKPLVKAEAKTEKDPLKRRILLESVRKMEKTKAKMLAKMDRGESDTSWKYEKEELKKAYGPSFPCNELRKFRQGLVKKHLNFASPNFKETAMDMMNEMERKGEGFDPVIDYGEVFMTKERKKNLEPKSFQGMIDKIEPVISALQERSITFGGLDPNSSAYKSFEKLKRDVAKWKSIPIQDRKKYSLETLKKNEAKWRAQISQCVCEMVGKATRDMNITM